MNFSEEIFIWSILRRPEDARRFSQIFDPRYLQTPEYRPILAEIYDFVKKKDIPPNVNVLREIFKERDPSQYEVRFQKALDQLEHMDPEPEVAEIIYHLDKAKDAAMAWSIKDMTQSIGFNQMIEDLDGPSIAKAIASWVRKFEGKSDSREMNIKEAIKHLIQERGLFKKDVAIPSNVKVIDRLSGGGLRPKQLGIIMAPTGEGKSMALMAMAKGFSMVEQKNTLFITNELSIEETAERMLSAITGGDLTAIIEDPIIGFKGLERHWAGGLDERLRIIEIMRDIDSNEIESIVGRYINLYGWSPDVVLIDYMERMKPTVSGYQRGETWNWLGAIAKDLVRASKRNNWVTWTAAQSNRSGLGAKVQSMSDAQGSIKHLQEAASVIAMRQTELNTGDEDTVILEFRPLKARHTSKMKTSILVEARLGVMEISDRVRHLSDFVNPDEDDEEDDGNGRKKRKKAAF